MSDQLRHSMFYEVLFPEELESSSAAQTHHLMLQKVVRYVPPAQLILEDATLVVFDFETTGLDPGSDRIVEIGAQRLRGFEVEAEFSTLVKPDIPLSRAASQVSGITEEMLKDQPTIDQVLPAFLQFFEGGVLIAHNAEFDLAFLKAACARLGYDIDWPCFCTLKMARALLPQLESKNLDTLARHFGLTFEARHRSIGDVKVTTEVLKAMLRSEGRDFTEWRHVQCYGVI